MATEEVMKRVLSYPELAHALKGVAKEKSEWAGLPMPISGQPLRMESKYPYAAVEKIGRRELTTEDVEENKDYEIPNQWYSNRLRGSVGILRRKSTGKSYHFLQPWNGGMMAIGTMAVADAWLLEAEQAALNKLGELIPHHMFRRYLLTGTFIESSKRSGVVYIFRKLRPTIAIKSHSDNSMRILCALCLHPIGYYEETWGGVMVPTDDVVAHLVLMRGDEHRFWKQANQHSAKNPASGI